jgi:hypothetical protein
MQIGGPGIVMLIMAIATVVGFVVQFATIWGDYGGFYFCAASVGGMAIYFNLQFSMFQVSVLLLVLLRGLIVPTWRRHTGAEMPRWPLRGQHATFLSHYKVEAAEIARMVK